MTTVLVVGGGLAGSLAAVAATRAGAAVTLVYAAPGATALSSGALDFTLPAPLPRQHPLARLGLDQAGLGTAIGEAASALVAGLRPAFELEGRWDQPGRYADLHGRPRPAALVPSVVARGELGRLREARARVAVIGFEAVSDYDAEATAEALHELAGLEAFPHRVRAQLPAGASLTDLRGRPAPAVKARAEAFAYPPGLTGLPEAGFELLATTPSPRGWDLQQALERMLEDAGVDVRRDRVHGFDGEPRHLEAALLAEERIPADAFVLATGHFIGGGLRKGRIAEEPLLDLGVFFDGRPARHDRRLAHLEYLDPAPAFETGVITDAELRPLDANGGVTYPNLRAAGAVLGGWDAGAGSAVPVLTGWLAGKLSA